MNNAKGFFRIENGVKSYRAIRHDVVRKKQRQNEDTVHHPNQKISQIKTALKGSSNLRILELFAGQGNLTIEYKRYGMVEAYDKKLETGDSFRIFHKLIYEGRKYDVVDIDSYGFPSRMMPDIFLLIERGYFFVTMPKPHINILNDLTRTHLVAYWGNDFQSIETIINRIVLHELCHWRQVQLVSKIDLGRLWRLVFEVEKVKATEYCNVKNR